MKKTVSILLALCMMFVFAACSAPAAPAAAPAAPAAAPAAPEAPAAAPEAPAAAPAPAAADEKFVVGIAIPTTQEEIWTMHAKELQAACEAKGWEVIVQSANGDSNAQIGQIENMLTSGIDALILAAADPGATGAVVAQAHKEGVFVVGYDRVNPADPYACFTTFDNVAVGRAMADYAVSVNPKGNYALLQGDATTIPSCPEIHQGWLEGLQSYVDSGDITIVYDQNCKNWSTDEGLAHAENALTASNNVMTAILCANDGIAAGAGQAVASAGLTGQVIVTGQDSEVAAAQRIVAGTQSITLYKAPAALAAITADAVEALLNGTALNANGEFEGIPMMMVNPVVVTAENIDEIFIEGGFMTKEQIYG